MGIVRKAKSFWNMNLEDFYEAMGMEEKMKYGIQKDAILEMARLLLENGVDIELVSKSSNLSLKEIEELQREIEEEKLKTS